MTKKLIVLLSFTLVVANRLRRGNMDEQDEDYLQESNGESNLPFIESCSNLTLDLLARYLQDADSNEESHTRVDTLLNECCSTGTTTAVPQYNTTMTTAIVSPSECSKTAQIPYITTVIVTLSSSCPQPPTTPFDQTATNNIKGQSSTQKTCAVSRNLTTTNMVLGALLGLSVLLLAVVTMGWMCTCLITKKRNRIKGVNTDDTEFEEKYFENPTYDGTSMIRLHGAMGPGVYRVPVLPVAAHKPQINDPGATCVTYDAVNTSSPKTGGNGQTYDVLDRGKVNGKRNTARNVRVPKGYSQLGLPDKDVGNNYHLINKENN